MLLVCGAVLVTSLGVELCFRVLDLRGYFAPRTRDWGHAILPGRLHTKGVEGIQFKPYASFGFRYDSNPRGYFDADNGLTYNLNRYGFRGEDFSPTKAPGTFRIIVLGDSFTFGEGVRLEDTFVAGLQELLASRSSRKIEVLNLGVSAWSTKDEIAYYENAARDFQADLVLVVFVLNDPGPEVIDLWDRFRESYEAPFPLKYSYIASFLYTRLVQKDAGRAYVESLVGSALTKKEKWEETFGHLARGQQLAQADGAKFAVVLFPFMYQLNDSYPFRPLHELVGEACRTNDIPYLDLFAAFEGQPYTDMWVHPSDQHPNEKGHAIAAQAIADFVVDDGLLTRAGEDGSARLE
jgi:lysophospholipase L1-like esterase